MARGRGFICFSYAIPLVFIVVAVETEQLPVAPIRRIVVVVMVLMMDRELVEFLAVKFAAAMRADPGKQFERPLSMALVLMRLAAPCHASSGRMDTYYGEILQELLAECSHQPRSEAGVVPVLMVVHPAQWLRTDSPQDV